MHGLAVGVHSRALEQHSYEDARSPLEDGITGRRRSNLPADRSLRAGT